MTTTTTPRRLLAIYPTQAAAALAAPFWKRVEADDADVQVVEGAKGTTPELPWAVTAAKAKRGGGS